MSVGPLRCDRGKEGIGAITEGHVRRSKYVGRDIGGRIAWRAAAVVAGLLVAACDDDAGACETLESAEAPATLTDRSSAGEHLPTDCQAPGLRVGERELVVSGVTARVLEGLDGERCLLLDVAARPDEAVPFTGMHLRLSVPEGEAAVNGEWLPLGPRASVASLDYQGGSHLAGEGEDLFTARGFARFESAGESSLRGTLRLDTSGLGLNGASPGGPVTLCAPFEGSTTSWEDAGLPCPLPRRSVNGSPAFVSSASARLLSTGGERRRVQVEILSDRRHDTADDEVTTTLELGFARDAPLGRPLRIGEEVDADFSYGCFCAPTSERAPPCAVGGTLTLREASDTLVVGELVIELRGADARGIDGRTVALYTPFRARAD